MKMKFGALVVDGRGKIGGHVASKNKAGAYLRTKVTPVNPQTSYQLGVRNRFTGFSQGWRGLTQAQRDAWNAAVSDFARTDVFGDLQKPTGFNLYQRLNNNLSIIGVSAITSPPLPAAVGVIEIDDVVSNTTAGTVVVDLIAAVPAGTSGKVFATAPQSAGKSFVKSEYRFLEVIANADGASPDISTSYDAKFGSNGVAGQKIFVKIVPVNDLTGQTGTATQGSVISSAP